MRRKPIYWLVVLPLQAAVLWTGLAASRVLQRYPLVMDVVGPVMLGLSIGLPIALVFLARCLVLKPPTSHPTKEIAEKQ